MPLTFPALELECLPAELHVLGIDQLEQVAILTLNSDSGSDFFFFFSIIFLSQIERLLDTMWKTEYERRSDSTIT
jgi:hypothetical protein